MEADLGAALAEVAAEYLRFLRAAEGEVDARAFGARHAAAKAALSHFDLLRKMSAETGPDAAGKLDLDQALLSEMRRDMSERSEETPTDDDGDPG